MELHIRTPAASDVRQTERQRRQRERRFRQPCKGPPRRQTVRDVELGSEELQGTVARASERKDGQRGGERACWCGA